jgi:Lon protease-like protein
MKAGNATYFGKSDLPSVVPVFPLSGALLLPGGQMPLNIFEPRYLAMIDDALCADRLIGMVQPRSAVGLETHVDSPAGPVLCDLGCLGRITAFQESGDGRYLINLTGVARYRIVAEEDMRNGYRRCRVDVFRDDLAEADKDETVDREGLLETFRRYLKANNMEADWDSINRAPNCALVTALCMMSPYGPAEKQALLEAPDVRTRAETLIAITEIILARSSSEPGSSIQ